MFGTDPNEELTPLERRLRARDEAREKGKVMRMYLRASSAGFEIGLSVVVGTVLGFYLDKKYDTAPYLLYAGLFGGILTAGRGIYRLVKSQVELADDDDKDPNDRQDARKEQGET